MSMGIKVAELNTLSDAKGITGIRFFNEMEDTNESTNLRKLADVWMSKNRCCQGHRNSNHCWHQKTQSRRRRSQSTSFPEPNLPQNVRFHQTPRSQNHRSRVPNPSWASIAAALPLKHVETRKNVVQNSTKTKDFSAGYSTLNNPHAQKLFVIIVVSGLQRHRFVCRWLNESFWVMAIGDRGWGRLRPVVGGL